MDSKTPVSQRTGRSLENIAAVNESVAETPKTSIRHRSQQLQISRSTTQRILTKDLDPDMRTKFSLLRSAN